MPDLTLVSRTIDEMVLSPISNEQGRQAALTVCVTLGGSGASTSQIREILECLGLLPPRAAAS
jgi:hypothetical protein